ncbi:MAG: hypothetical protein OJF62_002004 [Pseudolabrys sp.]|nr:hypothetical protein [Pseudolabrys sp.]
MKKLLSLLFALGVVGGSAAYGTPIVPLNAAHTSLATHVGYRCGLFGACAPVYIYGGHDLYYQGYRRGYYDGYRDASYPYVRYHYTRDVIAADRGFCGFGFYLSCAYGTCWRLCY